jgi:tRNA (cytidine/uridine-2'-O-)-methyltransferase
MFNIVLINPEIPQNTGNIARTVLALKCRLHLVKPLGFSIDDTMLKRAGLDYWQFVDVILWESVQDYFENNDLSRMHFFSKKGKKRYDMTGFQPGDHLVFGCESLGLSDEILQKYQDHTVYLPIMDTKVRSINLSSAVSVALFEAMRKNGAFDQLSRFE